MEFLRVKEIKVYCLLETAQSVSRYRLVCLGFFPYIFGLHATLSSFMPARQGIFVRDILGLVLGKCCKVRHSVTKPFSYKQYYSRKYNLCISLCCERSHVNISTTCRLEYRKLVLDIRFKTWEY